MSMTTSTIEPGPVVHVAPARFVTIPLAAVIRGLSEKAIRRKIEDGVWVEGTHYRKRDGRIFIDNEGVDKWVERG